MTILATVAGLIAGLIAGESRLEADGRVILSGSRTKRFRDEAPGGVPYKYLGINIWV